MTSQFFSRQSVGNLFFYETSMTVLSFFYSPFCVQAKVIKLVGLKNGGRLSPTNLITSACTQNGE
jgi:hypothetical protein